jgi:hypothetical protein
VEMAHEKKQAMLTRNVFHLIMHLASIENFSEVNGFEASL